VLNRAAAGALEDAGGDDFVRRNALRRALAGAVTLAGGEASGEYQELVAALAEYTSDLEVIGLDGRDPAALQLAAPGEDTRVLRSVVQISVPAAAGFVANAPVLAGVMLGRRRFPPDAWQATVMGVSATVLCPIVWAAEYGVLAHYLGRRPAIALTAVGAAGGLSAIAWAERFTKWRRITRRNALERDMPEAVETARRSRAAVRRAVESLVGGIDRVEVG